ncbi:MAG: tetratricopeptide repeat protein [candidate division Zixibacteria bacterium]
MRTIVNMRKENQGLSSYAIAVAYLATLSLFFIASFLAGYRSWGINFFGFYPVYVQVGLLVLGLCMGTVVFRKSPQLTSGENDLMGIKYCYLVCAFTILFCISFYLLRAQTYFLGDGLTLLSLISSDQPFIKGRNYGGTILQFLIVDLFGERTESNVLVAYQIVSITAGACFLAVTGWFSRKFLDSNVDRLLFFLGMSSGGYMLLFFGYVENYAFFIVSVATFCYLGILICQKRASRLFAVPALGLTIFFHVFGLIFVPATVFLLIQDSRFGNWIASQSKRFKSLTALTIVVIGCYLFYYLYTTSYFFRFAFVPIVGDRFTVDGYTLLSPEHIIDFINLIVLLFPALLVVGSALWFIPRRDMFRNRFHWFMVIAVISSLTTAFIFDPKLGMARDWDLFAFCGVPIGVGALLTLLKTKSRPALVRVAILFSILLSMTALFVRAHTCHDREAAVEQITSYLKLDPGRSYAALVILAKDQLQHGDTASAIQLRQNRLNLFPEMAHIELAGDLVRREEYNEAISLLNAAIKRNPTYWLGYSHLGVAQLGLGQLKDAIATLDIAHGLNPINAGINSNLGSTYAVLGDSAMAEKYWSEALLVDSTASGPTIGLLYYALKRREMAQVRRHLDRAATISEVPHSVFKTVTEESLTFGNYALAATALEYATKRSVDSLWVAQLIARYPDFQRFLKQ